MREKNEYVANCALRSCPRTPRHKDICRNIEPEVPATAAADARKLTSECRKSPATLSGVLANGRLKTKRTLNDVNSFVDFADAVSIR